MRNYTIVPEVLDNSNDGMIVENKSPGEKTNVRPNRIPKYSELSCGNVSIEMSQRHEPHGSITTIIPA